MNSLSKVGIVVNPHKPQVKEPLDELDEWLDEHHLPLEFFIYTSDSGYVKSSYSNIQHVSEDELFEKTDLIITMGGDGTILRVAHRVGEKKIPILGINLGGLGFLTDTTPESFIEHLNKVVNNNYIIESRTTLNCHVEKYYDSFIALNDFVFDKAGSSRVIEIITRIDDNLLNSYIADGIILSTPTGSTGYSLSAGGPIVIPNTNVFIVNPICPHSLSNRPVVVPDTSVITINVFTEHKEFNLYRDGEKMKSYPSGTGITIRKSKYPVNLIKMKNHNFYDTIRNKLHWGEDFRDKKRWSYNNSKK
jgi:NAD+ kinase